MDGAYVLELTREDGQVFRTCPYVPSRPTALDNALGELLVSPTMLGGGELLTKGAGIPHEELESRIVKETDKDLRYFLMLSIINNGDVNVYRINNWRFVPESWAIPALERDRQLLFPD